MPRKLPLSIYANAKHTNNQRFNCDVNDTGLTESRQDQVELRSVDLTSKKTSVGVKEIDSSEYKKMYGGASIDNFDFYRNQFSASNNKPDKRDFMISYDDFKNNLVFEEDENLNNIDDSKNDQSDFLSLQNINDKKFDISIKNKNNEIKIDNLINY